MKPMHASATLRRSPIRPVPEMELGGSSATPAAPPAGDPAPGPASLSEELSRLSEHFRDRPVPLAELAHVLRDRSYLLLLILLILPFLAPISLPGLSIPAGLLVGCAGVRLLLGRPPWWPPRLLQRQLPAGFFRTLVAASRRIVAVLERITRPRWFALQRPPFFDRALGSLLALSGVLLLLPLPIPFTNFFPALTVLVLSAASLGRDGLLFIGGVAAFLVSVGYLVLVTHGGAQLWTMFRTLG